MYAVSLHYIVTSLLTSNHAAHFKRTTTHGVVVYRPMIVPFLTWHRSCHSSITLSLDPWQALGASH